ncbi:MAG: hypothetical protein JSU05_12520 [Bacteroidetes bacterium]|nr:hypothetical protein [Bacteroidota bacterium]
MTFKPVSSNTKANFVTILIGISLMFSLSSCFTAERMNKLIAKKYTPEDTIAPKQRNPAITVSSGLPVFGTGYSTGVKSSGHLVPLIFFWHLEEKITTTLNPGFALKSFVSAVNTYSGKGLRQKLGARHIVLSLDNIPSVFDYDDKENMIWLLYTIEWEYISIQPHKEFMKVSYTLYDENNSVVKKGEVQVADYNQPYYIKFMGSPKKKIYEYLDQYSTNISTMSKKAIDDIEADL